MGCINNEDVTGKQGVVDVVSVRIGGPGAVNGWPAENVNEGVD